MAASDKTLSNYQVTASATAAKLFPSDGTGVKGRIMQNTSATVDAYWGDADVTSNNGMLLKAGTYLPLPDNFKGEVYVVTASSTADIRGITVR